mgnify:CR=1 FL=1
MGLKKDLVIEDEIKNIIALTKEGKEVKRADLNKFFNKSRIKIYY